MRRLLIGLVGGALLLAASPYIAAQAPFRNWLLGAALRQLNGRVEAGSATFDWFQPIALYDLQVHPPEGPPVLVVPAVQGSIPLWKILRDPSNLGVFRIDHPRVEIELREGGSTVADLLAKIEKEPQPDDQQPDADKLAGGASIGVDLISGSLTVRRRGADRSWSAREIQLSARVEPAVAGQQRALTVAPGRVLDHIAITPEVCDDFLKYLAPTLAKVTRAGGSFSLDLDECRLPLEMPRQGDVLGRLTLHDIQAGPGPMVEQIALMFGVPDANQLAKEQVVEFQLQDERAYHRDLVLAVGPMAMGTEGSVGLADQSLDLLLNVRLPKFANETAPVRAALSGQTLNLPIQGTLAQPQIATHVLRDSGLGVLSGVLDSLLQGKPLTADAIDGALRDGGLVGNGPTLPPPAQPESGANPDPTASPAPPAVNAAELAAPAAQLVEELLRQRAANLERRRAEAAANPNGSPTETVPPAGRPIRRGARRLLDALTRPPADANTPPANNPQPVPTPDV
ncbi:MAG: hypothetical protein JNG90_11355 [Planctomycetaceae bacterium]|nr:hypothetical protein [Planctomycetaceae bacterium]